MQLKTRGLALGVLVRLLLFGQLSWAQLPDSYKTVDHVRWVVTDLDRVTSGWSRLGFKEIQQHGTVTIKEAQFLGEPATVKVRRATGRLASLRVATRVYGAFACGNPVAFIESVLAIARQSFSTQQSVLAEGRMPGEGPGDPRRKK